MGHLHLTTTTIMWLCTRVQGGTQPCANSGVLLVTLYQFLTLLHARTFCHALIEPANLTIAPRRRGKIVHWREVSEEIVSVVC